MTGVLPNVIRMVAPSSTMSAWRRRTHRHGASFAHLLRLELAPDDLIGITSGRHAPITRAR